jgi:hypothetical protein
MWPFDLPGRHGLWLGLYITTFALHFVFVGYVLVGTLYALVQAVRKSDDPIAERVRDRLPFMLGCGITAGVAPLLFIQLLYQRHFYTANLLMGPRWGAVVPALIVGFYALYVAKASQKWRRHALVAGALCFLFVAWSWTELHLLMQHESVWSAMYAAGERMYGDAGTAPRLLLWLGVFGVLFASVAIWWTHEAPLRKRLAVIALAGNVVAGLACAWLSARGGSVAAHGWLHLFVIAAVIECGGWAWTWRVPDGPGALVAIGGGTAALLAGAVVREAPRIAILEPARHAAEDAGGLPTFVATAAFGVFAIVWIVQAIRGARPDDSN